MWIEIFRTGTHTDSQGKSAEYSPEQLDSIASLYNRKVAEDESFLAPVVKGHPQTDAPALGWVERLARRGEFLLARIKGVDPEFADEVREGRFAKVSMSVYPDMLLRHIGFLGAATPAVSGLRRPDLRQGSAFAEYEHQNPSGIVSAPASDSEIYSFPAPNPSEAALGSTANGEEINTDISSVSNGTFTQQIIRLSDRIAESDEKIRELEESNFRKREEIRELERTIENMEKAARAAEFRNYAESLTSADGKARFAPAQIDDIVELLEIVRIVDDSRPEAAEFAECDSNASSTLRRFIESKYEAVPFGTLAAIRGTDLALADQSIQNFSDPRWAVHSRAQDLLASSPSISYEKAAEQAFREIGDRAKF